MRKTRKTPGRVRGSKPAEASPGRNEGTRDRILQAALVEFADKTFSGGRLEAICAAADVNIRMIYHYFGDKAGLYVAVLEHALGELREEELKLDVDGVPPLEGMLQLFDFIHDHFASHPYLISLLSGENLLKAHYLKASQKTPIISSPVLGLIRRLLARGEADGTFRTGLDPLQLYVFLVGLSYFHRSNGHTLSVIFRTDVFKPAWLKAHKQLARDAVKRFVCAEFAIMDGLPSA
jgi:AcrR family transcriptional regulator